MNREQILSLIRGLACSTGLYGRLLDDIMTMPEEERNDYLAYLESLNFKTDLDVVLFFEEGKMPEGYERPAMTDNEIRKAVASELVAMIRNNLIGEFGPESFRGWLEDGDSFFNGGMTEEEVERAMALADRLDGVVDVINDVLAPRYDFDD